MANMPRKRERCGAISGYIRAWKWWPDRTRQRHQRFRTSLGLGPIMQDAEADDVHAPLVLDTVRHEQPLAGEPGVLERCRGAGVRDQHVRPELLEPESP